MQKWKIMLDFRLFAVKSMTFSLAPLFKNPGIYWKGILETFTRWPNSAPELLLLLLAVIFRYSTVIYTWIFENRVNESFIFFEVVLILRLSLKDTVSKLRSKEVFLFMSAVFLHLVQQLVAWKRFLLHLFFFLPLFFTLQVAAQGEERLPTWKEDFFRA